jgi:hypothetical protein
MRPPHDKYTQAAAVQFDRACRLMPRHSNQQIADAMSDVLGVTISRRAVADWRRGFTEIRAAYLLAAFDLAGIVQVLEIGALPAQRPSVEPARVLAPAAGGQTRRWNGRPRLHVIGAGLSFLLLLLWALPSTPLRPYMDMVVSYASQMAQPGHPAAPGSKPPSGTVNAPTANAPPQDQKVSSQPLPAATPATSTPSGATQPVAQSAAATPATPRAASAAEAAPQAASGPTPAPPPAATPAAAPQAGAPANPVAAGPQAPRQPAGLVPGVVNGVASTVDNTLGTLTGS